MKKNEKLFALFMFFLFSCTQVNAQFPLLIRKPQITKIENARLETVGNNIIILDENNQRKLNNFYIQKHSWLQFAYYNQGGKEFYESYWDYSKSNTHEITNYPASRNWKKGICWRKIPKETKYGKWEISLLPFPLDANDEKLSILRSGIIDINFADSVFFELDYKDILPSRVLEPIKTLPGLKMKMPKQSTINTQVIEPTKPLIMMPKNKRILSPITTEKKEETPAVFINANNLKWFYDDQIRKYYIRLIPLDDNKNIINKISNTITLQEIKYKELKPTVPLPYLSNDYKITAVKYVPVFFGLQQYANCTIITSYKNGPSEIDKTLQKTMEKSNPVGTVLCPSPKKEKSWYEISFEDVVGFLLKVIDGGANFYNEAKAFLKKKFLELNCNANLVTNVINPVTKLQEVAGPEVCNFIAGAAFEYGMAAVGLPPSLPNVEELTKMAEGQIVDLACDKLETETGLPVPEVVRDKIKKEFDENLKSQLKKGSVDGGLFYTKPHPLGQFQTAYLEIEITRTSNSFKGKSVVGMNVYENTTRTLQTYGYNDKQGKQVTLSGRLFEETSTSIPFIENIGDKKKVFIVLKPQESYVYIDKDKGYFQSIGTSPQTGIYNSVIPVNTYYSITNTPGFKTLSYKSNTTFNFGLKIDPNIQLKFDN